MSSIIYDTSTPEDMRFKTISEFKMCLRHGGEIQFEWKGVTYGCFGRVRPAPGEETRMVIAQAGSAEVNARTEMWCDTPDELLEYRVGEDRLRDVVTQVTVWYRTI